MRIEGEYLPLKITNSKHIANNFKEVLDETIEGDYEVNTLDLKDASKTRVDGGILAEVKKASQKYGVPEELILAIIQQESAFNPKAYNRNKDGTEDRGLMQVNYQHNIKLMKEYNIQDPDQLYHIPTNIEIGARILYENYKTYGNWILAVKAYNGINANNWNYVKSVFEKVSLFK